jgi:hypothetical protein
MANSFFGLVRLMISGGDGDEDPKKATLSCSTEANGKKTVISRWEFVDEEISGGSPTADTAIPGSTTTKPPPTSAEAEPTPTATTDSFTTERIDQRDENKKKLNKKKKSKRKRRANSVNSMEESKKGVRWGGVEVVNFSRDLVRIQLLIFLASPDLPLLPSYIRASTMFPTAETSPLVLGRK